MVEMAFLYSNVCGALWPSRTSKQIKGAPLIVSPKALITGASSGIGRAFALALARQGYSLTLVARRGRKLQDVINDINDLDRISSQVKHRIIVADLSKNEDVDQVCADITTNNYDLLINNAGAGLYKSFQSTPWTDIESRIQLNATTLAKLSYHYLAKAKSGDALINVASIVGFTPYPPADIYAATKAFVVSLSDALWHQYQPQNIYVMTLCPGATDTKFFEAAGVDRNKNLPRFYMQTPEAVVSTALQALKKRKKPTIIPGWQNKLFYLFMRILNRKALVQAVGKYSARQ